MINSNKESRQQDPFEVAKQEIEAMAQKAIKDYLLPLQTKKLSKKMIEQIAAQCASQIANNTLTASRKASRRNAAKLTDDFSKILNDPQLRATPVFNDKLATFAGQLTPEDI